MSESSETIQEIAFKLMLEQNKNDKILNGTTERTIFVLGSKGVVDIREAIVSDYFLTPLLSSRENRQ
jgi:hypothetical protein